MASTDIISVDAIASSRSIYATTPTNSLCSLIQARIFFINDD
ncbi:MAG: hypothetical protein VB140_07750 [Burkholderia sp.]